MTITWSYASTGSGCFNSSLFHNSNPISRPGVLYTYGCKCVYNVFYTSNRPSDKWTAYYNNTDGTTTKLTKLSDEESGRVAGPNICPYAFEWSQNQVSKWYHAPCYTPIIQCEYFGGADAHQGSKGVPTTFNVNNIYVGSLNTCTLPYL